MPASQLRLAAAALLAVGVAQAADLVTFLRLLAHHGARAEANPLVRAAATDLGVLPLVLVKVALVVLVVAAVAIVARTRARTSSVVLTLATIAGLVGAFSNVRAL